MIAVFLTLFACRPACEDEGTVCTVVGDGTEAFLGDGEKARDAVLYYPMDVTWRPGTDEYVIVDWNNERLRRVNADGLIETVVGANLPGDGAMAGGDRSGDGAPGTIVAMNHPVQAEFGPDGRMYIAAWHNHKVRRWDPETGLVRVVVANHDQTTGNNGGYAGDGGPAEEAHVWFPSSIAFHDDGAYSFVDMKNLVVRTVDVDGTIDTTIGCGEYDLVDGAALDAAFRFPESENSFQPRPGGAIEVDEDGVVWLADTWNGRIRRFDPAVGEVTTAPFEGLVNPTDLELGPDGRMYVADAGGHVIMAFDRDSGAGEVVVGTGSPGDGEDGLLGPDLALDNPYGIDFSDDGALYIADTYNSRIRRVTP